ncbi:hypothetical protein GU926_06705 [Nibribacter ruber]|uniref:DUF3826 domain-containing protein n=1 Tax=Nibribacter ruber TaxID=2698458 RepID=A0A6P1NTD8_9BACT|nr:hypothetical protein [Nibribacter ruber]QHL87136.1 hypothetical protein GU926_06705 [Nibribacter ruber]
MIWRTLGLAVALTSGAQLTALAQEVKNETTQEVKKEPVQESAVEQDLRQLKDWMRLQNDKVATTTRAEWPSIKSDFARHSDKIESGFQSLSEESKRDFLDLKATFQEMENRPAYDEIPLQAEEVRRREKELLGKFSNVQTIKAVQMREAYIVFLQSVRAKRQTWIPRDWDYAEYILQNLGKRKATVESQLTTLDEIKIRSLIGEFYTWRGGQEFKEKQKARSTAKPAQKK